MNAVPLPVADCDPPPKQPAPASNRLPPGSCDTHLHVFGPYARYPLDPRRNYTPHVCSLADYRQVMAALGISRAVLVQPSVYGTDNSAMLDALQQGGAALRGIAVCSPEIGDDELERMHQLGVRGLRLNLVNPQMVGFDETLQLVRRVAVMGWHLQVQLDLARKGPETLLSLCDQVDVPIVVDHMGKLATATRQHPLFDLVKAGRCWVKLTAPYRVSSEPAPHPDITGLVRALADANLSQLLWGTDWPHTEQQHGTPEAAALVDQLNAWFPDPQTRATICASNPARLYGYPPEIFQ